MNDWVGWLMLLVILAPVCLLVGKHEAGCPGRPFPSDTLTSNQCGECERLRRLLDKALDIMTWEQKLHLDKPHRHPRPDYGTADETFAPHEHEWTDHAYCVICKVEYSMAADKSTVCRKCGNDLALGPCPRKQYGEFCPADDSSDVDPWANNTADSQG